MTQFATVFTPVVVVACILIAVIPIARGTTDRKRWINLSLQILVTACPCALVLSTPVTIVAALAAAARQGVLIKASGGVQDQLHLIANASSPALSQDKRFEIHCSRCLQGGKVIEALARVRTVTFDKTGTLTRGQFQVNVSANLCKVLHCFVAKNANAYADAVGPARSADYLGSFYHRSYGREPCLESQRRRCSALLGAWKHTQHILYQHA